MGKKIRNVSNHFFEDHKANCKPNAHSQRLPLKVQKWEQPESVVSSNENFQSAKKELFETKDLIFWGKF